MARVRYRRFSIKRSPSLKLGRKKKLTSVIERIQLKYADKKYVSRATPNFFTLINMFSGFSSILMSAQGHYELAGALLFTAGFFDVIDGLSARMLGFTSEFGKELDSLADIISFGVTPGVMLHQAFLSEFGVVGIIFSSFPMLCGGLRLARYNLASNSVLKLPIYFVGLPIPAVGYTLTGLCLILLEEPSILLDFYPIDIGHFLIVTVSILSLLMVTNIPFYKIPLNKKPFQSKKCIELIALFSFLFIILFILVLFGFWQYAFFIVFFIYIVWCIIQWLCIKLIQLRK